MWKENFIENELERHAAGAMPNPVEEDSMNYVRRYKDTSILGKGDIGKDGMGKGAKSVKGKMDRLAEDEGWLLSAS